MQPVHDGPLRTPSLTAAACAGRGAAALAEAEGANSPGRVRGGVLLVVSEVRGATAAADFSAMPPLELRRTGPPPGSSTLPLELRRTG